MMKPATQFVKVPSTDIDSDFTEIQSRARELRRQYISNLISSAWNAIVKGNARFTKVLRDKRRLDEFGSAHRAAGLVAVVVLAIFGTLEWTHTHSAIGAIDFAQLTPTIGDQLPVAEYFPAKYVNQATLPEKHIESF